MRDPQVAFMGPGTNPGQAPSGNASRPGQPYPVRLRQREALASLRQAQGAGQPAAREKQPGALVKALGFLNNLW
jgi:hypothetical protein